MQSINAVLAPTEAPFRRVDIQGLLVAALCRDHWDDINRVIRHILRRHHWVETPDIEDLAQEAFARFLDAVSRGRVLATMNVRGYLTTTAVNVARNFISLGGKPRGNVALTDEWLRSEPSNEDVGSKSMLQALEQVVHGLPEFMRTLFELRFERNLSQHQTASELGLSRQTIRTLERNMFDQVRAALASLVAAEPCETAI